MQTNRINLWSSPRNISTALMYAFAELPDVTVVDEPLYAHYLVRQPTEAVHPGKADILAAQPHDGTLVVQQMQTHDYGTDTVVFKQMTHHLIDLDRGFLEDMKNVLLIRNPRAILNSFSKVVDRVTAEDIGIPQQYALFQQLRQAGRLDAIVDSSRLLQDPTGVLRKLCDRLDLKYSDKMLTWPAGPRPEDGVWAPYWYTNVHRSTGFQAYQPKTYVLSPALDAIAADCQQAYTEMLRQAI